MKATKTCASCGRSFEWRKKWERSWDEVRYCSQACRSAKPGPRERELETMILDLLSERAASSSICPSEVARSIAPHEWRPLMEPVRRAARRLVAAGKVQITQQGRPVDPATAKGPIRIRLKPR